MTNLRKRSSIALLLLILTLLSVSISPAADDPTAGKPAETPGANSLPSAAPSVEQATKSSQPAQPASGPALLAPLPEFGKSSGTGTSRIGYVDIVRIGQDSARGKAAQAQIKSRLEKLQAQVTSKQKQLDKQKNAIQEKLPSMSPDQRAAKAKEFEKKVTDFQKFVQKSDKDMQALQEELTRKLADEVKAAAASYGRANGLTAIVVSRDLLYQDSGVAMQDVTDELIRLVDGTAAK